jgi:hydroxypyruvate reductase
MANGSRRLMTRSLAGLRPGIVGLGSIGNALARRADALRLATFWWAPRYQPGVPWPRAPSLIELVHGTDVLVIAARVNESNRGLISATVLRSLAPPRANKSNLFCRAG